MRNPLGCAALFCILLFGALVGRAVFATVYETEALALLADLPNMERPLYRPAEVLFYALLPPLAYCALTAVSGLRRALLPLWVAAVFLQGGAWGIQLGAASALMACGQTKIAVLTVLLPMLGLLPLCGYIALAARAQLLPDAQTPQAGATPGASLAIMVVPCAAFLLLQTLFTTLTCLYCLRELFD